ncbi:MAG: 3-hydroxyacyl-CoA dehydrogenase, partial [Flavobacteriaceae bacterium]|nr:3-hydroxyacyl-CoA dehydrogenase [Flavobacteriaceae bacterium]
MADFHYEINDGVAVISWNTPTRNMNIMDLKSLSDLEIKIDKALSDNDVIGVIITSGKSNFSGGLDLGCISKIPGIISENFQENLFKGLKVFTNLTRKIELAGMNNKNTDGKPIVCTLDGDALGVGFEIALSCHKIFVSDNPIGKLGFPDILIGMPPVAGSISRLIRKIDKDLCASLLQNGEYINFENAIKHGLVDEMKSSDDLIPFAMQWIKSNLKKNIIKPWDMERYSSEEKILKKFSSLEDEIKQANKKSSLKGIHSSFGAMFEDLYKNKDINFDKALWAELNWLVNILTHSTQNSMVKTLHVHKPALEKGASRPSGVEHVPIKKVGILGAGMMGAGIAFVSAKVGVDVVLLDQNQEVVDRGLLSVKRMLDQGLKRNKFSTEDAKNIFERILPTVKYEDLNGCDLIIEAVFEDPKIKSLVTKSAEAEVSEGVIFATNTSTLPISELAKASCDQSKYIGIHFFSPVHLMNLVEIIKGKKTSNKAVAVALDFVKQIKKTPIVVNDERYFYANRCILPYINEGIRMLDEGLDPGLIDDAAKLMGMPVGPLQLADEISIELCFKIMTATRAAMGDSYPYS